jgi:hypothetical protein
VYIDKDHLHLCADPGADASPNASLGNCAGGHFRRKEPANSTVKCNPEIGRIAGVQQVQLEVVIAHVNKSALPKIAFPWAETQQGSACGKISFGVLKSQDKLRGSLQTLRSNGLAKILAEPRLTTLSGRPGSIFSGGEVPIMTSEGPGAPSVTYKKAGTEMSILPIVKANGKILLEVRAETTALDSVSSTKTAPAFKTKNAVVVSYIEAGQTLAIGGSILNDEEETVILVTPRLVGDCNENPPEPWQTRNSVDCPRSVTADHLVTLPLCEAGTVPCPIMAAPKKMTVGEIVQLSKHAGTEDIIVRQIELTNSVFNLTTQNLIDLLEQGVNVRVIRAMQESPDRIQPASHCVPSMRPR